MSDNQRQYREWFALNDADKKQDKAKEALEHALEVRKFEISLYWHRAAYFWALITVAFAGYFAVLSSEKLKDRDFFAFIIACIGLLFTWAWFLVNRGSKRWQENWENHVYQLEDATIGPLFKTVLSRPAPQKLSIEALITGPLPISVSKINQWVSTFTLAIWLLLAYKPLPGTSVRYLVVFAMTLIFGWCMQSRGRSDNDSYHHVLTKQESTIL